ncbi:RDD family protein [Streptomyces sp. NPDC048290]|uniref:RDD family protein n=1 Tax=Streptomyces sp. NPDC048290 TaxID=3155811 RepID=UPI0034365AF2
MSTQPPPGSGEPPDDDPFRKQPPPGEGAGSPYDAPRQQPPAWGGQGDQPPPPGGNEPPPGGGDQPPRYGDSPPPPGGEGQPPPYGGSPYGAPPGGYPGDPLAGMPPLADSGRRTLARIIDMVLVGIVVLLITWGFNVDEYNVNGDEVQVGRSLAQSAVAAVLYIAYDTFLISRTGQTLGKKWLKLRVANLDNGNTPSVQSSLIRAAILWIPFAFCCACVWTAICGGWSFFDKPYKQGLHDKPAKTVVVSTA